MAKKEFIQSLNPEDAFKVLLVVLNQNPDLEDTVYQIAKQVLCNITSDDVMNDVYNVLDRLDVEELYRRSGKTRYGYVEPYDEAWVMFEDALAPYIDEMKKYRKLDMLIVAKNYCIGIIGGIKKFEKDSFSEFTEWIVDAPGEKIETIFEEWKKGNVSEKDVAEVLKIMKL